jgi:hypothetical protein
MKVKENADWDDIHTVMQRGLSPPDEKGPADSITPEQTTTAQEARNAQTHLSTVGMAGSHHWLGNLAREMQRNAQQETTRLYQEIADLERRKTEAEVAVRVARASAKRLDQFDPVIAGKGQCPRCWGHDATHSDLRPIEIDLSAPDIDRFRCEICQTVFSRDAKR